MDGRSKDKRLKICSVRRDLGKKEGGKEKRNLLTQLMIPWAFCNTRFNIVVMFPYCTCFYFDFDKGHFTTISLTLHYSGESHPSCLPL